MVMYKNMEGFSNVTASVVLTERSVVTPYKTRLKKTHKNAFFEGLN